MIPIIGLCHPEGFVIHTTRGFPCASLASKCSQVCPSWACADWGLVEKNLETSKTQEMRNSYSPSWVHVQLLLCVPLLVHDLLADAHGDNFICIHILNVLHGLRYTVYINMHRRDNLNFIWIASYNYYNL